MLPKNKKTRSQIAKTQTERDICDCSTNLVRMEAAHKEELEKLFKTLMTQMQGDMNKASYMHQTQLKKKTHNDQITTTKAN